MDQIQSLQVNNLMLIFCQQLQDLKNRIILQFLFIISKCNHKPKEHYFLLNVIYIFLGVGRIHEITSSLQNNALEEALFKTEISTVIAEKNLAFAHKLVHKHKLRKEAGKVKLSQVETLIEKQIEAINAMEDNANSAAKIVAEVCNKKSVECEAQKSAKCDEKKSAYSEMIGLECENIKNSVNDPSTPLHTKN